MYRQELDKLQWRERWQTVKGIFLGLLMAAGIGGLVFFLSSPASVREVNGTVVDLFTVTGEAGATFHIRVQLENGDRVSTKIASGTAARIGRRVTLDEMTLWGGRQRYRFKYLHPEKADPRRGAKGREGKIQED